MNNLRLINGNYPTKRVTIFVGNFGSGKTEVAVNFALALSDAGAKNVSIVDLDIVNPYFRCREAAKKLEAAGVETIHPKGDYFWADLPIILPSVKGVLENKEKRVVLDVGGDDVGARVLASLADSIDRSEVEILFVLNISRPFTNDAKSAIRMIKKVSEGGKIPVTGLVGNSHLGDETLPDIIYKGIETAQEVAKETGIPVCFVSATKDLIGSLDCGRIKYPLFSITRQMLKPWELKG